MPVACSGVSSAWVGLIGVVVGGTITTRWSWLAELRRELNDGMVAAGLVDDDVRARAAGPTAESDTNVWKDNRTALARALGHHYWTAIADVYNPRADANMSDLCGKARVELAPWVNGKRYVVVRCCRNLRRWKRPTPTVGNTAGSG